jgi:hypothetical protein
VVGDLDAAGLTEIRGEGRARLIDPTSPGFAHADDDGRNRPPRLNDNEIRCGGAISP